jgi:hypothetical protein
VPRGLSHTKCLWNLGELVGQVTLPLHWLSAQTPQRHGEPEPGGGVSRGVMAAPDRALRLLRGEEPIMLDIVIKGGDKGMAIHGKTLHQYRRHTARDYKLPDGQLYHKGDKYLRRNITALSIKGACL